MPWCILGPFARFPSISDYTEFVRTIYRDFLGKSIDCEGNSKTLPTEKGVRLGISVKKSNGQTAVMMLCYIMQRLKNLSLIIFLKLFTTKYALL